MTDEERLPIEQRWVLSGIGYDEVARATDKSSAHGFAHELGVRGLSWLIARVLEEHYPADLFGDVGCHTVSWCSNEAGQELDPGVRWAILLRMALEEVHRA